MYLHLFSVYSFRSSFGYKVRKQGASSLGKKAPLARMASVGTEQGANSSVPCLLRAAVCCTYATCDSQEAPYFISVCTVLPAGSSLTMSAPSLIPPSSFVSICYSNQGGQYCNFGGIEPNNNLGEGELASQLLTAFCPSSFSVLRLIVAYCIFFCIRLH